MLLEGKDFTIVRGYDQEMCVFDNFGTRVKKLYAEDAYCYGTTRARQVTLDEVNGTERKKGQLGGNGNLQYMGEGYIMEYTANAPTTLSFIASFSMRNSSAAKIVVIDDVAKYGGIKACNGALLCMEPGVKLSMWNVPTAMVQVGRFDTYMQEFSGSGTLIMELPSKAPIVRVKVTRDNPAIFAAGCFGAMSAHLKIKTEPHEGNFLNNKLGHKIVVYTDGEEGYALFCGGSPRK